MTLLLVAFRNTRGPANFTLEVPATYLSVGQQIQSRLVSDGQPAHGSEPIAVSLLDSAGKPIVQTRVVLDGGAVAVAAVAAPRPGRYLLRATAGAVQRSVPLAVAPEPPPDFGGIMAVTALGFPAGAADYLRAHGFAVTAATSAGALADARFLVVGDPRLGVPARQLESVYAALWRQVDNGADALLLQPPSPAVAAFWPAAPPLMPARACTGGLRDPSLFNGLPGDADAAGALAPVDAFDLKGESALDLYSLYGAWLPRPNRHSGYPGCHALFSYRYGSGWVTLSTAPLLARFQDLRARVVLMNLVAGLRRRRPRVPASPGLAWVTRQKLARLAKQPVDALQLESDVTYRSAPASTAPVAELLPVGHGTCWTSLPGQAVGATLRLDLGRARPVHAIALNFGPDARFWPAGQRLEASPDGVHWSAVTAPAAPQSDGRETAALPASAGWRDIRLTLTAAAPHRALRLCSFVAAP